MKDGLNFTKKEYKKYYTGGEELIEKKKESTLGQIFALVIMAIPFVLFYYISMGRSKSRKKVSSIPTQGAPPGASGGTPQTGQTQMPTTAKKGWLPKFIIGIVGLLTVFGLTSDLIAGTAGQITT